MKNGFAPQPRTRALAGNLGFATVMVALTVLVHFWGLIALTAVIEGANGLILIGWSTAFLLTVTQRLRLLEHKWLDRALPPRNDSSASG